jgi:hypothetical protein
VASLALLTRYLTVIEMDALTQAVIDDRDGHFGGYDFLF